MRDKNIGCLPIVKPEKFVGLITAYDFLTVSAKLFEKKLKDFLQNYETQSEKQFDSPDAFPHPSSGKLADEFARPRKI